MKVHRVRLGADEYRVISPARPARGAYLHDRWAASMYVDREASEQLFAAWWLAARSPRSLVYVPMRGNGAAPDGLPDTAGEPVAPLDLVLVDHRVQFPVSRWKAVRARLGAGRLHTVKIPADGFRDEGADVHPLYGTEGFRDYLHFERAADTLFVVGSSLAFRQTGAMVRELIADEYAFRRGHGDPHHCVELSSGPWHRRRTRGRVSARLHIQYCEGMRAA
ncbi:hypothetical protein [Streptomyces albireticuli]|nr:hypothetical protein [Streptomyces albireticuli]MCD9144423.1 hypothetical protein [Streptomyces albireticuli]MCD9163514.1 hypothetical protein [Streptomyces albireticuli]MCD9193100.1 hypothetical protein [Streptomyces albireticuli]